MTDVLLATFCLLPDGEPGGDLIGALDRRGIAARWAVWDDPDVQWSEAGLVAVRSTWDYHRRCPEFLAWAEATAAVTPVLNGPAAFVWNADKSYLLALADRVPVVPTRLLQDAGLLTGLSDALDDWSTVVIKPRVGAGGRGVVVASRTDDARLQGLAAGPWVVQPLVESVRTTGESSVFVFGGQAACQVDKAPAGGEVRVHELYGGSSRPVALGAEQRDLAEAAVRASSEVLGTGLDYGRVDMMRWEDSWVVSEVELIEPGLYLDLVPDNADRFAELVATVVRRP